MIDVAHIQLRAGQAFEVSSRPCGITLPTRGRDTRAQHLDCAGRVALRDGKQAARVSDVGQECLIRRVAKDRQGLVVHLTREVKLAGHLIYEPSPVEGSGEQLGLSYLSRQGNGRFGKCSACGGTGLPPSEACGHGQCFDPEGVARP